MEDGDRQPSGDGTRKGDNPRADRSHRGPDLGSQVDPPVAPVRSLRGETLHDITRYRAGGPRAQEQRDERDDQWHECSRIGCTSKVPLWCDADQCSGHIRWRC